MMGSAGLSTFSFSSLSLTQRRVGGTRKDWLLDPRFQPWGSCSVICCVNKGLRHHRLLHPPTQHHQHTVRGQQQRRACSSPPTPSNAHRISRRTQDPIDLSSFDQGGAGHVADVLVTKSAPPPPLLATRLPEILGLLGTPDNGSFFSSSFAARSRPMATCGCSSIIASSCYRRGHSAMIIALITHPKSSIFYQLRSHSPVHSKSPRVDLPPSDASTSTLVPLKAFADPPFASR